MISSRRNFLFGVGAVLVAAPTIVRASSLMPVKAMLEPPRVRNIKAALDQRSRVVYWTYNDGRILDKWMEYNVDANEWDNTPADDYWEKYANGFDDQELAKFEPEPWTPPIQIVQKPDRTYPDMTMKQIYCEKYGVEL